MPARKSRSNAYDRTQAWWNDSRQVAKWHKRFSDNSASNSSQAKDGQKGHAQQKDDASEKFPSVGCPAEERPQTSQTENAEATNEHAKIEHHTTTETMPNGDAMPPWTMLPGARVLHASITEHRASFEDAANYRNLPQKFKQARRAGYVLCT